MQVKLDTFMSLVTTASNKVGVLLIKDEKAKS